jgi:tetratricopeptide (TPR) repeat protein
VKLLDFGIAKLLEGDGLSATGDPATQTQWALTPQFAAPEQVKGEGITTATDVYALGVLLYLILTGRHPYGPSPLSAAELVKIITETEPPAPSAVVAPSRAANDDAAASAARRSTTPDRLERALRGDLDTILGKALKKNPQERYPTVAAFAEDLQRHLRHEPIGARPDTLAYRAARFVRRNRMAVALGSLAMAASLAGLIGVLAQSRMVRAQRDFAMAQLSRAEAINDLNSYLLSDAAPSGKPFTVNELLGRAEHILARQSGQDATRVEMLISIGRQYDMQDEDAKARPLLEKAYRLSRDLPDHATRARASCALGSVLSRGPEMPRAEPLIREGLDELGDEPQSALDRVVCLLRGAHVSRNAGEPQVAIDRALEAQQVLKRSPFHSEARELAVLIDLAAYYTHAGRFREAIASFEQASGLLTSLGRDDTRNAATLFNNWAYALDTLGRPIDAVPVYRRAVAIVSDDRGEETVTAMLLVNSARALANLHQLDEAADYGERATAKASLARDDLVIDQSLLQRATTYRKQGDLDRARRMLDEVEPRLRRNLPEGHIGFAALASQRAQVALAGGNAPEALTHSDRALAILEASVKAGRQGAANLPGELARHAEIELQLGDFERAATDATQAVDRLQKLLEPGTLSSHLGGAYLALGRALLGRGQTEQARAALRSSLEHLESALGPDHPDTRRARQLAESEAARR